MCYREAGRMDYLRTVGTLHQSEGGISSFLLIGLLADLTHCRQRKSRLQGTGGELQNRIQHKGWVSLYFIVTDTNNAYQYRYSYWYLFPSCGCCLTDVVIKLASGVEGCTEEVVLPRLHTTTFFNILAAFSLNLIKWAHTFERFALSAMTGVHRM